MTLAATATISSNAGRSIDIQNRTGGTVTFNGAITDTGQGVFLNANTGSTINFTGGLSLSTDDQPGLHRDGRRHGVGDAEQHDDRQHHHDDDRHGAERGQHHHRRERADVPQHLGERRVRTASS